MFASRYFTPGYFAPRYWPKIGAAALPVEPDVVVRMRADVARVQMLEDVDTVRMRADAEVKFS